MRHGREGKARRRLDAVVAASMLGLLFLSVLPGCGPPSDRNGGERTGEPDAEIDDSRSERLLVLAASGLHMALEEMIPLYEEGTGERIDVVLGSSGNLAAQIRNGAPADLFFAANEAFLDDLVASGSVDARSRRVFAVGRLAIVTPEGSVPPADPSELVQPQFRVLAIANPEHAPYGSSARQALRSAGAWEALEDRIVMGENVAHALQFVRTGNADAGIVALSLVASAPGGSLPYRVVDDSLHPPLRQVAGTIRGSEREDGAKSFLDFVLSPEGQAILARHGFESPSEEGATERHLTATESRRTEGL